jgi:UDP-2,3-diacylglucosamine pyrophosphatase LpxH
MLFERLGPGRVNFVYDNEAFVLGPLLIEHGNRFDPWNAVSHGALRRVRSQASRQVLIKPAFPEPPGSRLVVDVLNPLKKRYPFVDLLKPEDAAALPVLAALGAAGISEAWRFFTNYRRAWAVDYDEDREPLDEELIADHRDDDQASFELANKLLTGTDEEQISGASVGDPPRHSRADALFRAFRAQRTKHSSAFDVEVESETYLAPARRAALAGFNVVVYGHTHLAKRVSLGSGVDFNPVYLNTGTWADLMRVPEAVWHPDDDRARSALSDFLSDLESGTLGRWRRPVPTYARIDMEDLTVRDADVRFCDTHERLSTEGLKRRLDTGASID